jgi:hypothetical protein
VSFETSSILLAAGLTRSKLSLSSVDHNSKLTATKPGDICVCNHLQSYFRMWLLVLTLSEVFWYAAVKEYLERRD